MNNIPAQRKEMISNSNLNCYSCSTGNFGRLYRAQMPPNSNSSIKDGDPMLHWHSCREGFHAYADGFYADHPSINEYAYCYAYDPTMPAGRNGMSIENLAEFMGRVENIVANASDLFGPDHFTGRSLFWRCAYVNPGSRVGDPVRKTNFPGNICWIEVNPWWKKHQMRHQFFTCCLRAALNYRGDNFYASLFTQPYFQTTGYAVSRFLDGFTWYTGETVGWQNAFQGFANGVDVQVIQKLLVRPPTIVNETPC